MRFAYSKPFLLITGLRECFCLHRISCISIPILACIITIIFLTLTYAQTGTVLEQGTNKPLQNALVSLKSSGALVLTDAQGKFDFSGSPVIHGKKLGYAVNPVTIKNNKLILSIEKDNTVMSGSIYNLNGKKIADLFKGTYNKGSFSYNISKLNNSHSFMILKVSLDNTSFTIPLVTQSPSLTVALSHSSVTSSSSLKFSKSSQSAQTTDTLIVSKYLYTPVIQPIAATNKIYLTKPSTPPPPPGMKSIPGGKYMRGSTGPSSNPDEQNVHEISISPFYMDSTELTQADYKSLMHIEPWVNYTPPNAGFKYPGKGNLYPAWYLTWNDAVLYCNERSKRDGFDTVYTYSSRTGEFGNNCKLTDVKVDYTKKGYRLPTEAEWEYAARAGTTTEYYWGNTADSTSLKYAWFSISLSKPEQLIKEIVGRIPNNFGMYDILGNVYELTNDYYDSFAYNIQEYTDPKGPVSGKQRIMRGGTFRLDRFEIRVARRMGITPDSRQYDLDQGVRVVLPNK
jgi:formylglycine-generating enzyme required for sulfatase activity